MPPRRSHGTAPPPQSLRASATDQLREDTRRLCKWDILTKGNVKGRAAVDPRGRPLRTVANHGGAKGDRLMIAGKEEVTGVCVRLLDPVPPLLTHDSIAQAMDVLDRAGGDVHTAARQLRHDDPSTLKALIKAWHDEYKVDPPPAYAAEDTALLSDAARARVALKAADFLDVAVVVEACGCNAALAAPALPVEFMGRTFPSGAELQRALPQPTTRQHALPRLVTHQMMLAPQEVWSDADALAASLAAQDVAPVAMVTVVATPRFHVALNAIALTPRRKDAWGATIGKLAQAAAAAAGGERAAAAPPPAAAEFKYRAVLGTEPEADVHRAGHLTPQGGEGGDGDAGGGATEGAGDAAVAAPTPQGTQCNSATILLAVDVGLLPAVEEGAKTAGGDGSNAATPSPTALATADGGGGTGGAPVNHGRAGPADGGADVATTATAGDDAPAPAPWPLVDDLATCFHKVSYPASLLQKAVRRGRTLCGPAPLKRSLRALLDAGVYHLPELQYQRTTGTRLAVWKTFIMALEDVCPYHTHGSEDECLSMVELVGLALVAHADVAFVLPAPLQARLLTTQLRLQAYDHAAALWPWRSWRWKKPTDANSKALQIEAVPMSTAAAPPTLGRAAAPAAEVAGVRNSLRVALLGLPLTRGERVILTRYLGGLDKNGVWARAVAMLPRTPEEQHTPPAPQAATATTTNEHHTSAAGDDGEVAAGGRKRVTFAVPPEARDGGGSADAAAARRMELLNREAELAAFDCQLKPSLLLLLQAGLPGVPQESTQHSLRALSEAVWMLSSGVNVRSLKQKISGAAQETYRFLSFVTDSPDAETEVTPEKLGIYNGGRHRTATDEVALKWQTTRDGQRLTAHEALLLDVLNIFQERMLAMLRGRPQVAEAVAVTGGAGTAGAAAAPTAPPAPPSSGRGPTPFERRTAFLQLFGAREVVSAADAAGKATGCMVALAGSRSAPVLVQRVSGATDAGDQTGRRGLSDKTLHRNAEQKLLAVLGKGRQLAPPPPPPVGFRWVWERRDDDVASSRSKRTGTRSVTIKATLPEDAAVAHAATPTGGADGNAAEGAADGPAGTEGGAPANPLSRLQCVVGGKPIPLFDAGALLVPCNEPTATRALPAAVDALVRAALYAPGTRVVDVTALFENLEVYAKETRAAGRGGSTANRRRFRLPHGVGACIRVEGAIADETCPREGLGEDEVYDWGGLAAASQLPKSVWRDLVIKIATREDTVVDIHRCARDGSKVGAALQPLSEGVLLRVLYVLQAVYPAVLIRKGELRFALLQRGAQFVHLQRTLSILAFGSFDDGVAFYSHINERHRGAAVGDGAITPAPAGGSAPLSAPDAAGDLAHAHGRNGSGGNCDAASDGNDSLFSFENGRDPDETADAVQHGGGIGRTQTPAAVSRGDDSDGGGESAFSFESDADEDEDEDEKEPGEAVGRDAATTATTRDNSGDIADPNTAANPSNMRGVSVTPKAASTVPFSCTTTLWDHQQEAVDRVLEGVGVGKRGFADASAVGAGKTLTALGCCVAVARWLEARRLRRHGFLVLVPNNDLIGEWIQQALLHTRGLHVVAQQHTGYLISRGVSAGGKRPTPHASTRRGSGLPKIDRNTIVISTLGRVRDKPFVTQAGWDLVVIDECLSVQNDTALQTAEAWRQVAASRCGVLMLSATFFRSRVSKLFYMIRMLRSALPRTEPYLPALLAEHVICYLPERTRTWKLLYTPVAMTPHAADVYHTRLTAAARAQKDPRLVYGELKTVIRDLWEPDDYVNAVVARCAALETEGRRVLVFANSEKELGRITAKLPRARTWANGAASAPAAVGAPLVITTQRGAYGLNLQREADSVVCRPQPGDLVEQMKGRVDRPGQTVKDLQMYVVYAAGTVEEVEAANLRLCGAFFRQYIDPLSRLFQEKAIDASLAALEHQPHAPRANTHGMREVPIKTGKAKDTTASKGTATPDENATTQANGNGGVGAGCILDGPLSGNVESNGKSTGASSGITTREGGKGGAPTTAAGTANVGGDLAAQFRQQIHAGLGSGAAELCESTGTTAARSAQGTTRKRGGGAVDDPAAGGGNGRAKRAKPDTTASQDAKNMEGKDGMTGTGGARRARGGSGNTAPKRKRASTEGGGDADATAAKPAKKAKPAAKPGAKAAAKPAGKRASAASGGVTQAHLANVGAEPGAAGSLDAETGDALPLIPRRMDTAACAKALEWLTKRDEKLATVIATVGPPTEMIGEIGKECALKSLVKSIIYQQISTKAANSILNKLRQVIGGEISVESLKSADDAGLRSAGLSRQKVSYVRALAEKFESGDLSDALFDTQTDEEVLRSLLGIKGMGEWSAHMFMMFKLGRSDILPVGDLAVRKAFQRLYGMTPHDAASETQVQYLPPPKEMQVIAQSWRPYRTVGTWYMWHVVENKDAGYTYGS